MALWIRSRICCWRAVSFGVSIIAGSGWCYCVDIQYLYF
jgi:hypothetical protein